MLLKDYINEQAYKFFINNDTNELFVNNCPFCPKIHIFLFDLNDAIPVYLIPLQQPLIPFHRNKFH